MFQSAYEELTLICSIIEYLRKNKDNIDVEHIRELITKSPLDNDHKHLIIEYLKDYIYDHDVDNYMDNLILLVDLIKEYAD